MQIYPDDLSLSLSQPSFDKQRVPYQGDGFFPCYLSTMAVEPAITVAIQSGNVPPEITVGYLMENRDPPAVVAIIFVAVLTFLVVTARCSSRYFIVKRFGLDDGLAFLSVVRTSVNRVRPHAAQNMTD
jgi:hypothetical protein